MAGSVREEDEKEQFRIKRLEAELAELKKAMERVCCLYCGFEQQRDPDPETAWRNGMRHVGECPKHPLAIAMTALEQVKRDPSRAFDCAHHGIQMVRRACGLSYSIDARFL